MNNIDKAIKLLLLGEVVAIPTETVYGLAADVTNDLAVAKIFAAKKRPNFNPLIIHVANFEQAEKIAVFNNAARELANKHWPGGLTLVLPKKDLGFAKLASAGLDTIAIRVPAHPIAHEILKQGGLILAAPSANISGKLSPTKAEHVRADFKDIHVVDGGDCEVGLESTVIGFDGEQPVLLREGVLQIPTANSHHPAEKITSPGQLLKHYSPKNPMRINADQANSDEVFLGFGDMNCDFNLSKSGDLKEAASNLFSMLHELDKKNLPIAVAKIPSKDIGVAINDRLKRAAK